MFSARDGMFQSDGEVRGPADDMIKLPEYACVVRTLPRGEHQYCLLLPRLKESPAARRIESLATPLDLLLGTARVRIGPGAGYVWIDDEAPAIILVENYYQQADELDLYLDLLHELTHLRQLAEGHDLWDESLPYVERATEIEGYSVAVEEGLRLGMTEDDILRHLSNPWMTRADVLRLRANVEQFLSNGVKSFSRGKARRIRNAHAD